MHIDIDGVVAQLGERSVRNAEVEGSSPFNSTLQRTYRIALEESTRATIIVALNYPLRPADYLTNTSSSEFALSADDTGRVL